MLPGISFLYFSNSFLIIITIIIIIIIIIIHTIQDIYFRTMYTYVNILYSVNKELNRIELLLLLLLLLLSFSY